MKKVILFLLLLINTITYSQVTEDLLVNIHTVSNITALNLLSPDKGTLAYNDNNDKLYVYDGTTWNQVGGGANSDLQLDITTGKLTLTSPLTTGNEVDLQAYVRIAPVKEITANYTLVTDDTGHVIYANSTTDITITLPSSLPVGFNVSVYQYGTGRVVFTGSGATVYHRLNRFKTAGQYAGVGIVSYKADEFNLTGDLRK